MKILVVAALVWAAGVIEARAADCFWGGLTLGSHHFDRGREKDYEQHNYGPHIETCLWREDVRAFGGWDRNSQRRDSVYVGVAWTPLHFGPVHFGAAFARVSGYGSVEIKETRGPDGRVTARKVEVNDEPVTGVLPVMMVELGRVGLNVLHVPKTSDNVAVTALQIKWRFR